MKLKKLAVLAVIGFALPLASCDNPLSNSENSAGPSTKVVVITETPTSEETVADSPQAAPAPAPAPSPAAPAAASALSAPSAPACNQPNFVADLNTIAPPQIAPNAKWVLYGDPTKFDPCADLGFMSVIADGATAGSPYQLMLYNKGKLLGTGTRCDLQLQSVMSSTNDSVTVQYGLRLGPGDSKRFPPVTYKWDGSKVQMIGTLPAEITQGRC